MGPTGAFIVILSAITAKYGLDGLQTATLMAGCILTLLGAARLGSIIKFIPDPVIIGFLEAAFRLAEAIKVSPTGPGRMLVEKLR